MATTRSSCPVPGVTARTRRTARQKTIDHMLSTLEADIESFGVLD